MNVARRQLHSLTHYIPSKTFEGYTLFAPLYGNDVWLIDMHGRFVHRWNMPYTPGCYGELLPNGNLLFAGKVLPGPLLEFGGSGGILIEVDWNGKPIWEYKEPYHSHCFFRMENGNTLISKWLAAPDEIAVRVKGGLPGTELRGVMWADSIQEISPSGQVLWEWLGYEHLDPEIDTLCPLCPRDRWTNINALYALPNGDILASFRLTNTIGIIDKATGDFKWRWGRGVIAHQHNPTLLDNGNILLFDNGAHRSVTSHNFSRVVEVNPRTGKIEWEYQEDPPFDLYSFVCSGAQRLPNGNTLICEATMGRIFEITPNKELVWEYVNPLYYDHFVYGRNNIVFRAYRYSVDYPGLRGTGLDDINVLHGPRELIPSLTKAALLSSPSDLSPGGMVEKRPGLGQKDQENLGQEKKLATRLKYLGY